MSPTVMAAGLLMAGRALTRDWTNVASRIGGQGDGGLDSLQDTTSATQQFYRVTVKVLP